MIVGEGCGLMGWCLRCLAVRGGEMVGVKKVCLGLRLGFWPENRVQTLGFVAESISLSARNFDANSRDGNLDECVFMSINL